MKQLSLVFSVLFMVTAACKTKKTAVVEEDNKIYETTDTAPMYPGGEKARQKFVVKNLVYPPLSIEAGNQGKVYVKFVVEKDGSISNAKAVKTFDKACGDESVRVISLMKWKPAEHKGKIVRCWVVMPIVFKLK